jgi:hypothetical protein
MPNSIRLAAMALGVLSLLLTGQSGVAQPMPDADVRQAIIEQSILAYPGNCPCPYSTTRSGKSCGVRSAYSRPGGRSPVCYAQDVGDKQIANFRAGHGVSAH